MPCGSRRRGAVTAIDLRATALSTPPARPSAVRPARLCALPTYQRRQPEGSVLCRTLQTHLDAFLARTGLGGRPAAFRDPRATGSPAVRASGAQVRPRALPALHGRDGRGVLVQGAWGVLPLV